MSFAMVAGSSRTTGDEDECTTASAVQERMEKTVRFSGHGNQISSIVRLASLHFLVECFSTSETTILLPLTLMRYYRETSILARLSVACRSVGLSF